MVTNMKNDLLKQYKNIRDTISQSLATLKLLITQANNLTNIAEKITGPDQSTVRDELNREIGSIEASITSLTSQIGKLFELYDKLAEELFDK